MLAKHLVPYTLEEAIRNIEHRDTQRILGTLWGASHYTDVGFLDQSLRDIEHYLLKKYKLSPKDLLDQTIRKSGDDKFDSPLHKEYYLVLNLVGCIKTLNFTYCDELVSKMSIDRKKRFDESYQKFEEFANEYNDKYNILGNDKEKIWTMFYVDSLSSQKPITDITKRTSLKERFNSLYDKTLTLARFYETERPAEYNKDSSFNRTLVFYLFYTLFSDKWGAAPNGEKCNAFWGQSRELKRIGKKNELYTTRLGLYTRDGYGFAIKRLISEAFEKVSKRDSAKAKK